MTPGTSNLTARLKQISFELRQLDDLLKSEITSDPALLNDLCNELDRVRFTAWSAKEMINAKRSHTSPDAVLTFLAAERLRRLEQMVRILCADIDRKAVGLKVSGIKSLNDSMSTLQERLRQRVKEPQEERPAKACRILEYEEVNKGGD